MSQKTTELDGLAVPDEFLQYRRQGLRVAVLAPLCPDGHINLNPRWIEPFKKAGIEIDFVKVGASDEEMNAALQGAHGVLLPGGNANIHPMFYDPLYKDDHQWPLRKDDLRDIQRDRTAMQMAWKAESLNIPTLGICRGMQEMIVAFGGRLEKLSDAGGIDHASGYRNDFNQNGLMEPEEIGRTVHEIYISDGTIMREIFGKGDLPVNSVHGEGITIKSWNQPENSDLRAKFRINAVAPDGVIEAVSYGNMLGVQAHFEVAHGDEHQFENHRRLFGHFFSKMQGYKFDHDTRFAGVSDPSVTGHVG